MWIKFSTKDTTYLCQALDKLVAYDTSKLFSRFAEISTYARQTALSTSKELKQKGMVYLDMETLNILLFAIVQFGGLFHNTTLEHQILDLKYSYELGGAVEQISELKEEKKS